MATVRAELRVNDKGHQELWYEGELWGTFDGRTGWLMVMERGYGFKRRPVSSKRVWDAGVKMHGAQAQPMQRKAPSKPRTRRATEPKQVATTPTLLEAIKAREVQLVGEPTEHNEAWIVYQHLEDVLAEYNLTLLAAQYHDIVQVVDRHPGQPRMGKALDGEWRMLKVEVLREPPISNPVTDTDYRGAHSAPQADADDAPLWDLTGIYPADVYGYDGDRLYGYGEPGAAEALSIARSCRNRPNRRVKIYRAVPREVSREDQIANLEKWKRAYLRRGKMPQEAVLEGFPSFDAMHSEIGRLKSLPPEQPKPQIKTINPGDWVTTVRSYAAAHGRSNLLNRYKILSKTVLASSLFTDGNSLLEWGYDPDGGKRLLHVRQAASNPTYDAFEAWLKANHWVEKRGDGVFINDQYHGYRWVIDRAAETASWEAIRGGKWVRVHEYPALALASPGKELPGVAAPPTKRPGPYIKIDGRVWRIVVFSPHTSEPEPLAGRGRTIGELGWGAIQRVTKTGDTTGKRVSVRFFAPPQISVAVGRGQYKSTTYEDLGDSMTAETTSPTTGGRRLNILSPDAFEKLTALEGKAWAADERKHADEPGRFFDAQDAYRILKEAGLADKHDLAEVADSPGFVGAEGEIYVIERSGNIALFADTASASKAKAAARVLRVINSSASPESQSPFWGRIVPGAPFSQVIENAWRDRLFLAIARRYPDMPTGGGGAAGLAEMYDRIMDSVADENERRKFERKIDRYAQSKNLTPRADWGMATWEHRPVEQYLRALTIEQLKGQPKIFSVIITRHNAFVVDNDMKQWPLHNTADPQHQWKRPLPTNKGEFVWTKDGWKLGDDIGRTWKSLQGTKTVTGEHDDAHYLVSVQGRGDAFQLVVPKSDLQDEIDFDTLAVESREKTVRASLEAEDIEAAKKVEDKDTRGWTDSMNAFKRARILNVLNAQVLSQGRAVARKKLIEARTDDGWTVKEVGGERRLVSPDGYSFFGEDQLTKIGMDYAQYLVGFASGKMVLDAESAGFDFFGGDDGEPAPKSGRDMVIEKLGEQPAYLAAERLLKPPILTKLVEPAAVHEFRKSRAWMLVTADEATARKVAKSARNNLVGKRSLTASDPFFHDKTLYVAYPEGFIEVEPPESAVKPKVRHKSPKQMLTERGRAIFGARGFAIHGKNGAYTAAIHPTTKRFRGLGERSLHGKTIEQLEARLDELLAKLGVE